MKQNRKLAEMVRGPRGNLKEKEAEIDRLPIVDLKEKCKALLRANTALLRERNELPIATKCTLL